MDNNYMQIRDPIHGVIFISFAERQVIDSMVFQRLRNIKQVGFADFAFPCASHNRYCHSLGAMFFAAKIFDRVFALGSIDQNEREKFRQALRLAAMLHDVGHPPLSHTTEMIMPLKRELDPNFVGDEQASHEDFTLKIILDSSLTKIIDDNFGDVGVTPMMVAGLLTKEHDGGQYKLGGIDYGPVLRQIISSEVDADRMDYLLRDSFFCGVNYGKFDSDWLINNFVGVLKNNTYYLGFKARAVFAFEDFLLSRYHMFASVYLHHTPVVLEKMLAKFFMECPTSFCLPADIDDYVALDDMDLWQALRRSDNYWAQRIVRRRPHLMLCEWFGGVQLKDQSASPDEIIAKLNKAQLSVITSRSKSVLSKYFGTIDSPLFVETSQGQHVPLDKFSQVFIRYQAPAELIRIFIAPEEKERAQKIIGS